MMKIVTFWRCLWILCAFSVLGVQSVQDFEVTPTDTEVNPEQTAVLNCRVRKRRGECIWLKNGAAVGKIFRKYQFEREPPDGDCSIQISATKLDEDDGVWQCQVTQASLHDPTLKSKEVRLTVREAPLSPLIEDKTIQIHQGDPFTTQAGEARRLHCVSRKGNPPALLRWFLDHEDISHLANQTNTTDVDKPRTWQAISVLDYTFHKEDNMRTLRCSAYHAAYDNSPSGNLGTREIAIKLEVMYRPEIRLEGKPHEDIVEGEHLSLRCMADANPPANIIWRKSGQASIYEIKQQIDFHPINRTNSGVYSCSAKNDVGESPEIQVKVDVKFAPKIIALKSLSGSVVTAGKALDMSCIAEGNPIPSFTWLQRIRSDRDDWIVRGHNTTLSVPNVTYAYQGQYICEAMNVIKEVKKRVKSEILNIDIVGPPQVLLESSKTRENLIVDKDEDAVITVVFCSDPKPTETFWEWGSFKLKTGNDMYRYIAEPLLSDEERNDCYEARLIVQRVEGGDSRKFTLNIHNSKGKESFSVALEVREPVAMSIVVGVIVGGVLLLIIILLVFVYLLKAEKMCFSRRNEFKPDVESDLESANSTEHTSSEKSKPDSTVNGAIPPDALYANTKTNGTSTENPQYENVKGGRVEARARDGTIVYASLDLPHQPGAERNGNPPAGQHPVRGGHERTEYAEIQFQPRGSPDRAERAEL